jgi:DNA-binding CsgD family transcriptional regulator
LNTKNPKNIESINLDKHIVSTGANEMEYFSQKLYGYGVSHFSYCKYRVEGDLCTYQVLTNQPEYSKYFLNKKLYMHSLGGKPSDYISCCALWSDVFPSGTALADSFLEHDIWNGIVIIKRQLDSVTFYYFAGTKSDTHLNSFYMNNLNLFKRHIAEFEHKGKPLLEESYKQRYLISNSHDQTFLASKNWQSLVDDPDAFPNLSKNVSKKKPTYIYLNYNNTHFHLTHREHEILYWLSLGKNSGDISLICDISESTVRKHIENIKLKSGCYTLFQLGHLFAQI